MNPYLEEIGLDILDLVEQLEDTVEEKVGFVCGAYVQGKYISTHAIEYYIYNKYSIALSDDQMQFLLDRINSDWKGIRIIDDRYSTTYVVEPDYELKRYASFDTSYLQLPIGYKVNNIVLDRELNVLYLYAKDAEYMLQRTSDEAKRSIRGDGILIRGDKLFMLLYL